MSEELELSHLSNTMNIIDTRLEELNINLEAAQQRVLEAKRNLWQNLYDMDKTDIIHSKSEIYSGFDDYDFAEREAERLIKLRPSPYFGRVDFNDPELSDTYYIGLYGLSRTKTLEIVVYDWRAPVSSLFYDDEVGPASYTAPCGEIKGEITLRRQFKIVGGKLKYMLDSSLKIDDEVLCEELSRSTSPKMRNIIATIQKEQNRVIRGSHLKTVIVQGVPGSGKTSVALHRVAFLLYSQRGKLNSKNFLILSPNKVFSDYISGILPELGEENVAELSFDELAARELDIPFESRWDQLEYMLSRRANDARLKSIEFKSSPEFLKLLKEYSDSLFEINFKPHAIIYNEKEIPLETISDMFYNRFGSRPFMVRLSWLCDYCVDKLEMELKKNLGTRAVKALNNMILRMVRVSDPIRLYDNFLKDLIKRGYTQVLPLNTEKADYEDVFPMALLKFYQNGATDFAKIKHLVIDEMQDYSSIQYAIINYLFDCPKTILGDLGQKLHTLSGVTSLNDFSDTMGGVEVIELCKSYRSSYEISEFANSINPVGGFTAVERHGNSPKVERLDEGEISQRIAGDYAALKEMGHSSMAVICKTMDEAQRIYKKLPPGTGAVLLKPDSTVFPRGLIIATSYLVKGLEFDGVIIPDASGIRYSSEMDKQSLYVACTRALHMLHVYYRGEKSAFLPD